MYSRSIITCQWLLPAESFYCLRSFVGGGRRLEVECERRKHRLHAPQHGATAFDEASAERRQTRAASALEANELSAERGLIVLEKPPSGAIRDPALADAGRERSRAVDGFEERHETRIEPLGMASRENPIDEGNQAHMHIFTYW